MRLTDRQRRLLMALAREIVAARRQLEPYWPYTVTSSSYYYNQVRELTRMHNMLTQNFTQAEFRCKHCGQEGIRLEFVQLLQEFRDFMGKPIQVTSNAQPHPETVKLRFSPGPTRKSGEVKGKPKAAVINDRRH
jgi:hypothetical protein